MNVTNLIYWSSGMNEKPVPSEEKILKKASKKKPYAPKKLFNLQTKCPVLFRSLTAIKSLITYFKQSFLNSKLSTTLKQAVDTRWDSDLLMMESYVKVREEVETLLLKNKKLDKIQDIDNNVLDELISFLSPIRKCSKTLSGDKYPTIQLVAICYTELKEEINNFKPKSNEMTLLVQQAKICAEEYVVISDLHYMASILDPR